MLMPTGGFSWRSGPPAAPRGRLELNTYRHPGKAALAAFVSAALAFLLIGLCARLAGLRAGTLGTEIAVFTAATSAAALLSAAAALAANRRILKRSDDPSSAVS